MKIVTIPKFGVIMNCVSVNLGISLIKLTGNSHKSVEFRRILEEQPSRGLLIIKLCQYVNIHRNVIGGSKTPKLTKTMAAYISNRSTTHIQHTAVRLRVTTVILIIIIISRTYTNFGVYPTAASQ